MRVLEESTMARAGANSADADTLIDRGFAQQVGNKVQRVSRLLEKYLEEQPNENGALFRMFGGVASYQQNLKGVLEHRLAQIDNLDGSLKRFLEQGVADFPDHPDVFLSSVHGI